jgi:hypothetical protein
VRAEESTAFSFNRGCVKNRAGFALLAMLAVGVAFSGCGGGGGGGSTPPTSPPSGSPGPVFTGARPAADGDEFTFSGAMNAQYVRPPLTATPLPSPNPASSASSAATIAQQVTVTSGATFQARTNLFDFHIVENDVAALKTTTLVTDEYLAYGTAGATTAVSIVGSVTRSSDGAVFQTVYGPGNGLLDVLPHAPGRIGIAPNNAALVLTEADPDGQITSRSVSPDGTYLEQAQFPDGSTSMAVEYANGTGSFSSPFVITNNSAYGNGLPPPNTLFSVAQPATGASGAYIPISIAYSYGAAPVPTAPATPVPTPTPVARAVQPVWYPNGAIPSAFSSETYVNAGSAVPPAACNLPPGLLAGKTTDQLVQSIARIDIVFGETEVETTTSYTADSLGVVCMLLTDLVTHYYDFSGQTVKVFATSGTPLQIDTLNEVLTLQSATVKTSGTQRPAAEGRGLSAVSVLPLALSAAHLAFERERLRRHAERFRSLHRRVAGRPVQ